jgi:Tol biopolymer transport system component
MRYFILSIILTIMVISACGGGRGSASDGSGHYEERDVEKIVFHSNRSGDAFQIFVIDYDGTNLLQLTDEGENFFPSWSPDRSMIAYTSVEDEERFQIYTMRANGRFQRNISENQGPEKEPTYTPDGTQLVYASAIQGNYDIWIMNEDGSDKKQLTIHLRDDFAPSVTPDGNYIIFTSARDGNEEIYQMTIQGTEFKNLTQSDSYDSYGMVSPTGDQIVFQSDRTGTPQIFVMNRDGGNPKQVSKDVPMAIRPCFSRDGEKVVYSGGEEDALDLRVVDTDGRNPELLEGQSTPNSSEYPRWSFQ